MYSYEQRPSRSLVLECGLASRSIGRLPEACLAAFAPSRWRLTHETSSLSLSTHAVAAGVVCGAAALVDVTTPWLSPLIDAGAAAVTAAIAAHAVGCLDDSSVARDRLRRAFERVDPQVARTSAGRMLGLYASESSVRWDPDRIARTALRSLVRSTVSMSAGRYIPWLGSALKLYGALNAAVGGVRLVAQLERAARPTTAIRVYRLPSPVRASLPARVAATVTARASIPPPALTGPMRVLDLAELPEFAWAA